MWLLISVLFHFGRVQLLPFREMSTVPNMNVSKFFETTCNRSEYTVFFHFRNNRGGLTHTSTVPPMISLVILFLHNLAYAIK